MALNQGARDYERLSDQELADCAARRDPGAVRIITTRNNQRLFRAAWSVLKNRADAEDAVQDAYLKAFTSNAPFAGRSSLSTWLTRIVINEALRRKRSIAARKQLLESGGVTLLDEFRDAFMNAGAARQTPENLVARGQIAKLLEAAIARLPDDFRTVFVLREVEGLSIEETAEMLGLPARTVKTRHFRARRKLVNGLDPELKSALSETFPFAGVDCENMTARTLCALGLPHQPRGTTNA